jgi:hypothetical protein
MSDIPEADVLIDVAAKYVQAITMDYQHGRRLTKTEFLRLCAGLRAPPAAGFSATHRRAYKEEEIIAAVGYFASSGKEVFG